MFRIVEQGSADYDAALRTLVERGQNDLDRVELEVRAIIAAVRSKGDAALIEYAQRFEQRAQKDVALPKAAWAKISRTLASDQRAWLEAAAQRIADYHAHQIEKGFRYEKDGVTLGLRVDAIESVGVYAPGGKARYPSSVLMTAVPARVAGVKRIVLATPNPSAEIIAAAEIAGVTEIIDAGGAQAIAALAYGTQSVKPVDKIVGPGNLYVACAKRLVFGAVDIDSIAGPSEILVIADEQADPKLIAADMLTQAEHDEAAYALLIVSQKELAERVKEEVKAQAGTLPRKEIATKALAERGCCFVTRDTDESARVANMLAPEHLSLLVADPETWLPRIRAAGAIFLGYDTPEAAGDYAAGPSHVLPTGGAARYASPLGVYDFVRRSSLISYSAQAIRDQAALLCGLARLEGLEAHARAVELRRKS